MELLCFLVSFLSSIVGAICGIGGGVIIKPVLDLMQMGSAATINFLSGCTVLSMSAYSVARLLRSGEKRVDTVTGTPLAIGAAVGGLVGKALFNLLRAQFADGGAVSGVQAAVLTAITVGTLIYTLVKERVTTRRCSGVVFCLSAGLLLGVMSSFLGIGGGPINLVVLGYLFSMDTKTAAANSLYIIVFSQFASLASTVLGGDIPAFAPLSLALMVAGGIGGGIVGRRANRKMDNRAVDRLFIALMSVIIFICIFNTYRGFAG